VTRRTSVFAVLLIAVAAGAARVVVGQADPVSARLKSGSLPVVPVQAVSAGEVLLSLDVSDGGAVGAIDMLRSTQPFTQAVTDAVRGWRFNPALDALRSPMASRVLVGAMFGSPSIRTPTVGEPPKDVAPAATALPMPLTTPIPAYPPNARSAGTVLLEVLVAPSGKVVAVTAIRSAPPFDEPAMEAARSWSFRPPQGAGLPPNTYAYLIFAFRPPVVGAAPKP
jgi:TonB family protein